VVALLIGHRAPKTESGQKCTSGLDALLDGRLWFRLQENHLECPLGAIEHIVSSAWSPHPLKTPNNLSTIKILAPWISQPSPQLPVPRHEQRYRIPEHLRVGVRPALPVCTMKIACRRRACDLIRLADARGGPGRNVSLTYRGPQRKKDSHGHVHLVSDIQDRSTKPRAFLTWRCASKMRSAQRWMPC
jgi:hypothetical protein